MIVKYLCFILPYTNLIINLPNITINDLFITILNTNNGINRLKVVLAERRRSNKWLAQNLHVTVGTVSKWCVNKSQPSLETLREIAIELDVDIRELLHKTKPS
jgi:DNA-binding XRE family transcriptional regulator